MTNVATTTEFLPKGYQVPDKAKQFMKLTPGDNVIRVLSAPLLGWLFFNEENKPVRRHIEEGEFTRAELTDLKAKRNSDGDFEGAKHFWMLLVWDYSTNAPKILEITQVSILKPLYALVENPKWGDPRKFDINIGRVGTGKNDTEFTVMPEPHTKLNGDQDSTLKMLEDNKMLDLNAIWRSEYPFETYIW